MIQNPILVTYKGDSQNSHQQGVGEVYSVISFFLFGFTRMAAMMMMNPSRQVIGANLIRVSLKMSALNISSVVPSPDIRINPMMMIAIPTPRSM